MLTVNQILDLSKQGFTAEQIEYLNSFHPASADQGTNAEDATQSDSSAASATHSEDLSSGDAIKALSTQIAALSDTVKQMQAVNAKKAEQQPPQKVTADSIIKDFFGKKEGK